MPLIKSSSKKAVGKNIEREVAAGKPRKQAIAIALDEQRRSGRKHKAKERKEKLNKWAHGDAKSNVSEYRT